jgi:hypothetical protein
VRRDAAARRACAARLAAAPTGSRLLRAADGGGRRALAGGPVPGDAAVHLYRTFLVRSGALVWDNFYPFHLVDVAGLLGVCGVGAVVARRARADVITRRLFSCADMLYVELVLAGAGIRVG